MQGSKQKVRPGTDASCFNQMTDIMRVEIHEQKGAARYGGKLFNQDDRPRMAICTVP